MSNRTLIIHGWSDSSSSFGHVKQFLSERDLGPVEHIYFGDYESKEDSLTFYDIADGLQTELINRGLIQSDGTTDNSFNVIVHSTGGLVIRHWIWRYYLKEGNRMDDCPIDRLVMLAPANFGSPLAHRGKSFLGSLLKGKWDFEDFLEVGKTLLTGLELASPYQWTLAHRDLIHPTAPYRPDQIETTILVGAQGYSGLIGSYTNKPSTDGTVVISGTPLNALKLTMNCCPTKPGRASAAPIRWNVQQSNVDIAFGILPEKNHGTIVSDIGEGGPLDDFLSRALTTESMDDFQSLKRDCRQTTSSTYENTRTPKFQQFHVRAIDDQDQLINDYSLEFSVVKTSKIEDGIARNVRMSETERAWNSTIHEALTESFHSHSQNASHRRFLVNIPRLKTLLRDAKEEIGEELGLALGIHVPDIDEGITYDTDNLQNIIIHRTDQTSSERPSFFYSNTTTLVELRVNRTTDLVTVQTEPRSH